MKSITTISYIVLFVLFMMINITIEKPEKYLVSDEISIETEKKDSVECINRINIGFNSVTASDPGEGGDPGGSCTATACLESSPCISYENCPYRITCDGCGCGFEQVGSLVGSSRCGD